MDPEQWTKKAIAELSRATCANSVILKEVRLDVSLFANCHNPGGEACIPPPEATGEYRGAWIEFTMDAFTPVASKGGYRQ